MARTGVTYLDIESAAVQLVQQDKQPTVDAVREILKTGSKSTIAPLLKEWKTKQAGIVTDERNGLPQDLLVSVKNLYDGIQLQSNERIEAIKTKTKNDIDAIKSEFLAIQKTNTDLQSQLTKYETIIDKLKKENDFMQDNLLQEQQAHVKATTQQKSLQQRMDDRNHEILRLNKQLGQVQQNLDHYRDTAQQQRGQERADFDRQLLSNEQAMKQLQVEKQSFQQSFSLAEKKYIEVNADREQLQITNKTLSEQYQQQGDKIIQIQQRISNITGQYEMAQEANNKLEIKNNDLIKHLTLLEKQVAVVQDKIQVITLSKNKVQNKIETLMDETSFLKLEKASIEGQFKQLQRSIK